MTGPTSTPPSGAPGCTIVVRFANRPGALYRVLGVLGRHGVTVDRLVVAPTEEGTTSRATLVIAPAHVALILRQLRRLLPVIGVELLSDVGTPAADAPRTAPLALEARGDAAVVPHIEER